MLNGAAQLEGEQEEELSQEEAHDEIPVDGIGVGLLLTAYEAQADECNGQEEDAGHQADVGDDVLQQRRLSHAL